MKIYVASSWRCDAQAGVVTRLREEGHEVYDFKNPAPGNVGFGWKQCSSKPPTEWTSEEFNDVLDTQRAREGFWLDMHALKWCEACVLVRPCGRSAHLELGYAVGAGKLSIVLLTEPPPFEPELMYLMCDRICTSLDETVGFLTRPRLRDVVRYGHGPTALMRVTDISRRHGGRMDYYYGDQFFGGAVAAYEDRVYHATPEEIVRFEKEETSRFSRHKTGLTNA